MNVRIRQYFREAESFLAASAPRRASAATAPFSRTRYFKIDGRRERSGPGPAFARSIATHHFQRVLRPQQAEHGLQVMLYIAAGPRGRWRGPAARVVELAQAARRSRRRRCPRPAGGGAGGAPRRQGARRGATNSRGTRANAAAPAAGAARAGGGGTRGGGTRGGAAPGAPPAGAGARAPRAAAGARRARRGACAACT